MNKNVLTKILETKEEVILDMEDRQTKTASLLDEKQSLIEHLKEGQGKLEGKMKRFDAANKKIEEKVKKASSSL
jgi:hypothetical protein